MKFLIQKNLSFSKKNVLIYKNEEYSFDTEPHDGFGFTSVMVNDLRLEIDDDGKIIYVWGLCPLVECEETNEIPKDYVHGNLIALLDTPLIPGISHRLNQSERWPVYINKNTGWICIGNPQIRGEQSIEFIPNCVAVLNRQEIIALWLKPKKS